MFPDDVFAHRYLRLAYTKGLRTGGWRRLSLEDRALFNCALWVAKVRGRLSNMRLMVRVAGILMKLLADFKARAIRVGRARAERLIACLQERRAEELASRACEWFKDRRYVTYLGVMAMNDGEA